MSDMDDRDILSIDSPKLKTDGPYVVIFKDEENRWAIVALDWEKEPRLGMRWFWGERGYPHSRQFRTWFHIPCELTNSILNGLPIRHDQLALVQKYLVGEIDGPTLQSDW